MKQNFIIMGVSGCGKSTIAELLATELNATFYDGDDFHPQSNIDKMASGVPLTDADRQPWLETLANTIKASEKNTVTACSALKKSYRDILRSAGDVTFIYLQGTKETLLSRLTERSSSTDHFMPSSLLDSQLETLEDPSDEENTLSISIEKSVTQIMTQIITQIMTQIMTQIQRAF